MDVEPFQNVSVLNDEVSNVDTIILNLPVDDLPLSQFQIDNTSIGDDLVLSVDGDSETAQNSSLVKSEGGQLFLVTYRNKQIVSKHFINLQINPEDFTDLKCEIGSQHEGISDTLGCKKISEPFIIPGHSNVSVPRTDITNQQFEEKSASGDALQRAMQEIELPGADPLEPVPYEVKLAALNALIPSDLPDSTDKINFDCAICSKNFHRKYELKTHLSRHFGLNISLCPVCGKQFSHPSNLSRHMRIHTGNKPYKCKVPNCGKRFNQANSLHTHRAYVHGENNHRVSCPLCGRLYKTAQLLKRHCKINHQNEAVDLNFPPATSTVSKRQFYCTECGESFSAKYQLKKHLEQHNQLNTETHENGTGKNVTANELQLNFDAIDSMLREIQDEHKSMNEEGSILKHHDSINETIDEVIKKVNNFICLECGKQFHRYMSYKQHWGVHETSLRKFECNVCGMSFAWKSTYAKHLARNHTSSPPSKIACSESGCGKEYKSLSQLQEHIKRDHQLIRRFSCEECSKMFYKAHDLLVHKRTHTKEKPYMCGTCGKYFSHISHVIRHEKSHNNIRPYSCPVCNKSFTQATVLKAHRIKKCPETRELANQNQGDAPLISTTGPI